MPDYLGTICNNMMDVWVQFFFFFFFFGGGGGGGS